MDQGLALSMGSKGGADEPLGSCEGKPAAMKEEGREINMRTRTLVLAVASVALGTLAFTDTVAAQVTSPTPVATPPLLSAPSNAPVVTPSVIPPSTPSTQPTNSRGVEMPGMSAITASTLPAAVNRNGGDLVNPGNTTLTPSARGLTEQQAVPAGGTLNSRTTSDTINQGASGNTVTGQRAVPNATLDNNADDMLLHDRTTGTGTNQSSSGGTGTGTQAIPSGSRLGNDDLLNNNTGNGTNSNANSSQGTIGTGTPQLQGTGTNQGTETLPGAPGPHRFVDPNRHDAFQPLTTPRQTPAAAPNSNNAGGAAPAPSGGNTAK